MVCAGPGLNVKATVLMCRSSKSLPESFGYFMRYSMFRQPRRKAFTLVPLLVVIAIIGILIAAVTAVQAARGQRRACSTIETDRACPAQHHSALRAFPFRQGGTAGLNGGTAARAVVWLVSYSHGASFVVPADRQRRTAAGNPVTPWGPRVWKYQYDHGEFKFPGSFAQ